MKGRCVTPFRDQKTEAYKRELAQATQLAWAGLSDSKTHDFLLHQSYHFIPSYIGKYKQKKA